MRRAPLTRLVQEERGQVLLVALLTIVIASLLAGAAVTVALSNGSESTHERNVQVASEAAEAGLQVALYRTNKYAPASNQCVGSTLATPTAGTNYTCQSELTTMRKGVTWQYYTSAAADTAHCVGADVTDSGSGTISNICITAVGTANGVSYRSQIRAAGVATGPAFGNAGITGLQSIADLNNMTIASTEASNGPINAKNGSSISGPLTLGPAGTYTGPSNPAQTKLTSPIVLPAASPGQAAISNDDSYVTNGLANPVVKPADAISGSVNWDPTTHELTLGNDASWTLGGGSYYFCSLMINGNNVNIHLGATVRTQIFIDSPADNPNCPAGSGQFQVKNNLTWTNPTLDPTALQIYVFGPDTGPSNNICANNGNAVQFGNNDTFYGTVFAPTSDVCVNNNGAIYGAIAGNTVTLSNNGTFTSDSRTQNIIVSTQPLYYRTAWGACTAAFPPSDPEEGCG